MIDSGSLLTTKDVQALINVDKSTIYRMAETGRIPAIKVGRQWRFPADQIERWLTRRPHTGHGQANPSRRSDPASRSDPLFGSSPSTPVGGRPGRRAPRRHGRRHRHGRPGALRGRQPVRLLRRRRGASRSARSLRRTDGNVSVPVASSPAMDTEPSRVSSAPGRSSGSTPGWSAWSSSVAFGPKTGHPTHDSSEAIAADLGVEPVRGSHRMLEGVYDLDTDDRAPGADVAARRSPTSSPHWPRSDAMLHARFARSRRSPAGPPPPRSRLPEPMKQGSSP